MMRTENQTPGRVGVAAFASHTPLYPPPATGGYPYGRPTPTAGPSHNRVAIIGATGVTLLLLAMGGLAYLKAQDATVTATAPIVAMAPAAAPVGATVPHGAAAELAATLAMSPPEVVVVTRVPHGAAAELADALADVPVVTAPAVPHGAVPVS